VAFGPDSKIYFTEWGEGWEGTGRGRIFRVYDERSILDPKVAEVQQLLASGLKQKAPVELRDLLRHTDQRIRLEGEWALVAAPDGEYLLREAGALSDRWAGAATRATARNLGPRRHPRAEPIPDTRRQCENPRAAVTAARKRRSGSAAQAARVLGEQRVAVAFDGLIKMLRS